MLFGMLVCLTLPVWLVCLAFALPLPVVAAGAFAWGLAIELFMVLWFTALQTNVPRESLSRVMRLRRHGLADVRPDRAGAGRAAGRRRGAADGIPARGRRSPLVAILASLLSSVGAQPAHPRMPQEPQAAV